MSAVVFIGFMGSGKTTAAKTFAKQSGVDAIDVDERIEQQSGRSITELFAERGESGFRELEEQLTLQLLKEAQPGTPIALGGGAIESESIRNHLQNHTVVLREISLTSAWERAMRKTHRPLAQNEQEFADRYTRRASLYEQSADVFLPEGDKTLLRDAHRDLAAFQQRKLVKAKMVWADSKSGSYPVFLGRHVLGKIWPATSSKRWFCVADQQVAKTYLSAFSETFFGVHELPGGEATKTLASAEQVWQALLAHQADKETEIVALGGGVIGDLAGFCAATYQRGIGVIHCPTTVVAQVDSAYGGKTGVDLPHGKNYVGVYHQPTGVITDLEVLATLSDPERAAGFVEVIKTALIAGGDLWQYVAREGLAALDNDAVILGCVRQKLKIVAEDERDSGMRQRLNLGHTVGHAIEAATGFTRFRHGEAVGLGLLAALRLSGQSQLRDQVHELLSAANLPVQVSALDVDDVLREIQHDKKRVGDSVPFVLVDQPGSVRHGCQVAAGDLLSAVAELSTEG